MKKNHQLNISDLNLAELLRESIERVRIRYDLDAAAISLIQTDSEIKIPEDADELQTVFTNLLDNAVKYSGEKIKVSVAVKKP